MDTEQISRLFEGGIDYTDGIDRFGGNEALFEKFILRFPNDTHFTELHEALGESDAEAGFRAAHTLKGVVGNLSFRAYYEALTPVTELLREGEIARALDFMGDVDRAHARVLEALSQIAPGEAKP